MTTTTTTETVVFTIKMPRAKKEAAMKLAESMGVSLGTVINYKVDEFLVDQSVTFKPLVPNKKTAKVLEKASKDIEEGKNIAVVLKTEDDVKEYFDEIIG